MPLLNMMNIHGCLLNQKVDAGLNRLGIYLLIGKDQTNSMSVGSLEERQCQLHQLQDASIVSSYCVVFCQHVGEHR